MDKDRVNGIGEKFRLITPILITIALFILSIILSEMKEMKSLFANHLEHHRVIEVKLGERLSSIETILKMGKR